MNKKLLLLSLPIFLSLSILFLTTSPTFAENDSTDPIYNIENGKFYQFVPDIGISWIDAENISKESSHGVFTGQLAVITTQDENDFITNLLPDESSAWIGLKVSDEGFKWINEETFDYSNWSSYQPTSGDYEDYVELFEYNGKWNDTVNGNHDVTGYIVEYTPNFVYPEIDPIYNPENGHYYQVIQGQDEYAWQDIVDFTSTFVFNGTQGHLVTITDNDESQFIRSIVPYEGIRYMIGLNYDTSEDKFKWVTGEPFEYTSWVGGENYTVKGLGYGTIAMKHNSVIGFNWLEEDYYTTSPFYIVEFSP